MHVEDYNNHIINMWKCVQNKLVVFEKENISFTLSLIFNELMNSSRSFHIYTSSTMINLQCPPVQHDLYKETFHHSLMLTRSVHMAATDPNASYWVATSISNHHHFISHGSFQPFKNVYAKMRRNFFLSISRPCYKLQNSYDFRSFHLNIMMRKMETSVSSVVDRV